MTAPPKLCLLDDWRRVARRAWSIRLSIVAALFTAAEVVVPLFGDVLQDVIPGGHPNSSTCGHLKFPHPPRPA